MANTKAALVWLCRTEKGWRRYPAVFGKNGRPRAGWAKVGGEEREYPQGRFQVRYFQGSKLRYADLGDASSGDAMVARQKQARVLAAHAAAKLAGVRIEEEHEYRLNLRRAADLFVQSAKDRGAAESADVYRLATDEFFEVSGRRFADEVTAEDVSAYQRALRQRGCSDRTIYNRHMNLRSFLRFCKLDVAALAPAKPKYEKTIPEVYTPEELRIFFEAIDDDRHRIAFEILLQCGLRDQEAIHLEWSSVHLAQGTLRVQANPRFGFKVKDCEQRDVPIPAELAEKLREFRKKNTRRILVIGTKNDLPDTKLLLKLKTIARRAKLNCGSCEGCRKRKECGRWYLHKFRATYITTLIRSGMDLRTIMKLSGHSDLASVMRYLSPASDEAIRNHVSGVKWR